MQLLLAERREAHQTASCQLVAGKGSFYAPQSKSVTVSCGLNELHALGKKEAKKLKVAQANVVLQSALRDSTREEMDALMLEMKIIQNSLATRCDERPQIVAQ